MDDAMYEIDYVIHAMLHVMDYVLYKFCYLI